MKASIFISLLISSVCLAACGGGAASNQASIRANVTPEITAIEKQQPIDDKDKKNGLYQGQGGVTKVNLEIGSVELKHEDIPGLMPAMLMEFYVKDKASLKDIKPGDFVTFTLEYKDGTETITSIKKGGK